MARKKKTMDKPGDTSDISTKDSQTTVEVDSKARPEPDPDKKFPIVGIGASAREPYCLMPAASPA